MSNIKMETNKLNLTGNEKVNFARGSFYHILESSQKENLTNTGICGTSFANRSGGESVLNIENGVGCTSCMVKAGYIKKIYSDVVETEYEVLVDFKATNELINKMHFTSSQDIAENSNLVVGQIFGIGK